MSQLAYPPPPWRLTGILQASLFITRKALDLGSTSLRPIRLFGWTPVVCAVAAYEGDLAYDELMLAVPVLGPQGFGVTIPLIWVDSPASAEGGRSLWAIPKRLGRFHAAGEGGRFRDGDGPVAGWSGARRLRLPGRWPLAVRVLQPRAGVVHATPARMRGQPSFADLRWSFEGVLAELGLKGPLISGRLDADALEFG